MVVSVVGNTGNIYVGKLLIFIKNIFQIIIFFLYSHYWRKSSEIGQRDMVRAAWFIWYWIENQEDLLHIK